MKTVFFRGLDTVDHYDEMQSFEWLGDFLEIPNVSKKIADLKIDRRRVSALPLPKSDFKNRLKVDYGKIQEERIRWLKKYFLENQDNKNPLQYYLQRSTQAQSMAGFAPYVSWTEIEAAFDEIPEGQGAISPQKKEEKLFVIDKELAELQVELDRISPPYFFLKRNGIIVGDKRQFFINAWQELQNKMSEPCGPCGYTLTKSSKAEKAAWGKFYLLHAVNPNGKYVPDPGDKK